MDKPTDLYLCFLFISFKEQFTNVFITAVLVFSPFKSSVVVPAVDPVSQRLQQRRSQADPLRRVLLTTQMKV